MIRTAIAYALVDMCLNLIDREIKLNVDVQSRIDGFKEEIAKLKSFGFSDKIIKSIIDTHGADALTAFAHPTDVIVVNVDMTTGKWVAPQQNGKTHIGFDLVWDMEKKNG